MSASSPMPIFKQQWKKLQNSFIANITDFSHLHINCIPVVSTSRPSDLVTKHIKLHKIMWNKKKLSCLKHLYLCFWNHLLYTFVPSDWLSFTHNALSHTEMSQLIHLKLYMDHFQQNYQYCYHKFHWRLLKPLNTMLSNVQLMSTKCYQNTKCRFHSSISIISVPKKLCCWLKCVKKVFLTEVTQVPVIKSKPLSSVLVPSCMTFNTKCNLRWSLIFEEGDENDPHFRTITWPVPYCSKTLYIFETWQFQFLFHLVIVNS